MVRTKVFVGNLSFNTRDNELAKEFEVAGKVISANIITRGPRSLGYGFVEMDNEEDAENAVKLLDKKEIDGRPINVEVAKPREEGADAAAQANAQGVARTGGQRRRGSRGPRPDQTGAPRTQQPKSNQNQTGAPQGGNNGQFRRRKSDEEGTRGGRPPRTARPPRVEGEPDNRTPSKTTLFVANLPFAIEDDSFAKVLKDASLSYKTAHVVKKRSGRSKGFGFIEFDSESDQQKALAALNNKDLEGRPLAVKVALTELRSEDLQTGAPAKSSSPAPAKASSSSPAPAKAATTTSAPAKTSSSPAPAKAATTSSPAPAKTSSSPAPAKTTTNATQSPKQDKK